MTKILITFVFAAFAFQLQAQLFVNSNAKLKTIKRMEAIEQEFLGKSKNTTKLLAAHRSSEAKKLEVLNYLSQKTGKNLSNSDNKVIIKAHRETKKSDTKYAELYKAANRELSKKRNKFAKRSEEYKTLLTSLSTGKKKK